MRDPAALLGEAIRRINGDFELRDVLGEVLDHVLEAAGAARAIAVAWTPESPEPIARGQRGMPAPFDEVPSLLPVIEAAAKSGRIVWTEDAAKDERFRDIAHRSGLHVRRLGAAPVFSLGRPCGAVAYYGDSPGALQREAAAVLAEAAHCCAMALEVSALRDQKLVDPATGLLTHRTFLGRVNEELFRATRHGRPFSLVRAAPEAGRDAARELRRQIRPGDVLAHAAGDHEFAILLPETRRGEAAGIAEQIRAVLPGAYAVASVPEDAVEAETLFLALDAALGHGQGVHTPAGPAKADGAAPRPLAGREGRALGAMLRTAFAQDLELRTQAELAASLIEGALSKRSALAILEPGGDWYFTSGTGDDAKEMMRRAGDRGQKLRDGASLAVPLGRRVGVVWTAEAREHEEHLLLALAEAIADELAKSAEMQKRRDEVRAQQERLARAVDELRKKYDFSAIVGSGPALTEVLQIVARAAETDAPVLITGESGTGKELLARAVHANSARRKHPFTVLNCAAVAPSLIESELFGHTAGAFTSAVGARKGLFESAHRGTVFLDEIGEIPVEVQAKLLRALQFGEIQRVGSDERVRVDVRIVAATNRDLTEEVRRKRFREDLFYRINVFRVHVPRLRDHPEDIPALVEHFCDRFARDFKRESIRPDPEALDLLMRYGYPGNVRELENILLRAIAMSTGRTIAAKHLPPEVTGGASVTPFAVPKTAEELDTLKTRITKETTDRLEVEFLRHALKESRGNVSEAARRTGMHRTFMHTLLARHSIDPGEYRVPPGS